MHWIRIATAVALTAIGQAALADAVVIRANGPSAARFPPGKTLPDSTRLTLQRGDQIVLLDARGTRTLAGPGTFAANGGPSTPAPSGLSAVTAIATSRRARVGAVRGFSVASAPQLRPGIFLVDVAAPGKVCVVDPASVTLWRGDTRAAATTTLTASDGRAATVSWIAGQETAPWPTTLPVASDASYQLRPATGGAGVTVQFQTLAAAPADLPQLAAALIGHGCQAQLDVLIAKTRVVPATGN